MSESRMRYRNFCVSNSGSSLMKPHPNERASVGHGFTFHSSSISLVQKAPFTSSLSRKIGMSGYHWRTLATQMRVSRRSRRCAAM